MLKWLFKLSFVPNPGWKLCFFPLNYCLMGGNFCQAFYTSVFTHQVVFFKKKLFGTVNFCCVAGIPFLSSWRNTIASSLTYIKVFLFKALSNTCLLPR